MQSTRQRCAVGGIAGTDRGLIERQSAIWQTHNEVVPSYREIVLTQPGKRWGYQERARRGKKDCCLGSMGIVNLTSPAGVIEADTALFLDGECAVLMRDCGGSEWVAKKPGCKTRLVNIRLSQGHP